MGTEDMENFERVRRETTKTLIGTHSDSFHCDEVLATSMLLQTRQFQDSIIVRTRVEDVFPKLDIVVDVGGVYDAEKMRFDHHQSTFEESWTNSPSDITKLSSAGLVYKHFGREIICNAVKDNWGITLEGDRLERVYQKMYTRLILEVDAQDCGVSEAPEMKYYIKTGLGARIARTNPEWNAPKTKTQHKQFKKAMKIAEEEFFFALRGIVLVHMPAYNVVREAFDAREQFHPCGELMFMDRFAPWKDFIFEIEKELNLEGKLKFMISQD